MVTSSPFAANSPCALAMYRPAWLLVLGVQSRAIFTATVPVCGREGEGGQAVSDSRVAAAAAAAAAAATGLARAEGDSSLGAACSTSNACTQSPARRSPTPC